ncbi:YIP1 family protein [Deinococcus arenicola]|uniref:YIP1 family protein n=1 Tax=Deinococcus arenicola TaxID=2994950 RepID=A0ABU4DNX7_9DEIO|nr:YIP1 family protein [Deinococcus sp. ZS9-10]MDV6374068.1 YIP1 family protein [Deinococcus sp. ZS9-10]
MRSPVSSGPEVSLQDMFAQSTAVITQPSVATFERYERRGGLRSAFIYVMVAAVISALIAAFFGIFHPSVNPLLQFFSRLVTIPVQFLIFTGAVYLIGGSLFKGTGTYPEVAYTFALFFVPLTIISTIIGIIPILGWLVSFLISLVMIYFGYLAVQSSMNLREQVPAIATLVLAGIANFVVGLVLGGLFVVSSIASGG